MDYTQNLNLPQWEASDRILRTDFNDAMASIDAGVAAYGNCKISYGSYTGTGEYGAGHPNRLNFTFTPKIVIFLPCSDVTTAIMGTGGAPSLLAINWGVTQTFRMYGTSDSLTNHLSYTDNTISWYNTTSADYQQNSPGTTYYYAALG